MSLYIAGMDTTSLFLTFLIYVLAKYPKVQAKLREEINSTLKSDHDLTLETLNNM
jgi:cytochrome P450